MTEAQKSSRIVRLVVRVRHNKLRDRRRERLRGCPDAAVMNERGTSRQQLTERRETDVLHRVRKISRNVIGVPREQDAAFSETEARLR